jgi:hypothetical protein
MGHRSSVDSEHITDSNAEPLQVARSRGGVTAICDVQRALLHDKTTPWPPALKRNLKRSGQIRAFDPPGRDDLQSGFYCDLQSLASEDAMTWSFFGPLVASSRNARARLLNWVPLCLQP